MRTSFSQPLASALLVFGLLAATDRVRAELEPSELIFDVAEDVPDEDLQTIKSGIEIVRIYIQEFLGGDIPTEIRSTTTVKVVATGLGNQEPGGGGACCTAFSEENPSGVRLFFDVLHPQWILAGGPGKVIDGVFVTDRDKNRLQRGAHEYAHAWQNSIGCISLHDQRMGFWLNEGIAEYVAWHALIHQGAFRPREVAKFHLEGALQSGQLDVPLEDFGEPTHEIWPGDVGYLAVDQLASRAPEGPLSVRRICEEFASGQPLADAFESAFGIGVEEFYNEFEPKLPAPKAMPWLLLLLDD